MNNDIEKFAPHYTADEYSADDIGIAGPFFTNLDKVVYAPLIFSPELIGALCSRTSRAKGDLRKTFLGEFLKPFLSPEREDDDSDQDWAEKTAVSRNLNEYIDFLRTHPADKLLFNPKARSFYLKWLAQYGDDSIAQMAGAHIVYSALSQVAIKHLEDQRIGLAPLEKSTRYVDYSVKTGGKFLYYTDPSLADMGLQEEYTRVMNELFATYAALIPKMIDYFAKKYPEEKSATIRTKAFDTLRGLLPMATLSQVAFFGNGQAFEYMYNRCAGNKLGEIRWAGYAAKRELDRLIPAFLRRVEGEQSVEYQKYMSGRGAAAKHYKTEEDLETAALVRLVECDPNAEEKIITGLLYPETHESWEYTFKKVKKMPGAERSKILDEFFATRKARWYKVPRAFENAFVRFEITMDLGAWRDLHRHRMQTQMRQRFSPRHGYGVPPEIIDAGFEQDYRSVVEKVENLYYKIEKHDPELAQYAVCMIHRVRFMQYQNLRQFFWEAELRSIPEGHPNYRIVEQQKFQLLQQVYPNLMKHAQVNMGDYVFARRGQEEKIKAKEDELKKLSD